jgi:uncharacterized membrane protein
MAGIRAIFVGILWFFGATFFLAGVLNWGTWVIPVVFVLAIVVGVAELSDAKKKWTRQRVRRIEQEEIIREQIRRQMRGGG